MFDPLLQKIRQRTREQYRDVVRTFFTDIRIWIQEHPEPAFIVALVLGSVFVLLFKLIAILAVLAVLAGFVVYCIALDPENTVQTVSNSESTKDLEPKL